jgi:exopolysaccharide production protein ExoZ
VARQSYLPNIQILRFIAALMVLFAHLLRATVDHKIPQMRSLSDASGIEWGTGVDVFFIVSGFIMYYLTSTHFGSGTYAGEFLKRRMLRVVPLYWLFTVLMLFSIWQFNAMVQHTDASPSTVVASLLFYPIARPDGHIKPILLLGWTLEYEMFFYACFALSLLYRRRLALIGLTAVFVTLAVLHRFIPVAATSLRFWSDPIILEFLLGILLAHLYLRNVRVSWSMQCALVVTAVALMSLLGHSHFLPNWIWGGFPAFVLVAALALGPEWSVRPLSMGGDASYSFYLSHPFALNALALAWTRASLPPDAWLFVATGLVFCLFVALGVYRFVELPLLSLLRRRFEPRWAQLSA